MCLDTSGYSLLAGGANKCLAQKVTLQGLSCNFALYQALVPDLKQLVPLKAHQKEKGDHPDDGGRKKPMACFSITSQIGNKNHNTARLKRTVEKQQ